MAGRWKKGEASPNPAGRPKGIIDKRMRLTQQFQAEGEAIASKVIEQAVQGDLAAAKLVLDRIAPPLRTKSQTVQFDLDTAQDFTSQAKQILAAIAQGELDPDTGKILIDAVTSVARVFELDEISRRLEVLENVQTVA